MMDFHSVIQYRSFAQSRPPRSPQRARANTWSLLSRSFFARSSVTTQAAITPSAIIAPYP